MLLHFFVICFVGLGWVFRLYSTLKTRKFENKGLEFFKRRNWWELQPCRYAIQLPRQKCMKASFSWLVAPNDWNQYSLTSRNCPTFKHAPGWVSLHVYICILARTRTVTLMQAFFTTVHTSQTGPQSCLGPNQQDHPLGWSQKKPCPSSTGQPGLISRPVLVPGDTPGARTGWIQGPSAHAMDLLLFCWMPCSSHLLCLSCAVSCFRSKNTHWGRECVQEGAQTDVLTGGNVLSLLTL